MTCFFLAVSTVLAISNMPEKKKPQNLSEKMAVQSQRYS